MSAERMLAGIALGLALTFGPPLAIACLGLIGSLLVALPAADHGKSRSDLIAILSFALYDSVPLLAAGIAANVLMWRAAVTAGRGEPRWPVVLLAGAVAGGAVAVCINIPILGWASAEAGSSGATAVARKIIAEGLVQGGLYSGLLYLAWQAVRRGRRALAVIPLAAVLVWAGLGVATWAGVDPTASLQEPPKTFRAPPPQPYRTAFDPTEYRRYATPGKASVLGEAPIDEQWDGRGAKVVPKPLTSLSREWWARTIQGGEQELYSPSSWEEHDRSALADDSGRFRFDSLPVGDYFLAAHVVSRRRQLDDTLRWAWFGDSLKVQDSQPLTIMLPKAR